MFYVSDIFSSAPSVFKTDLQKKTYEALKKLNIPFERVDTDEVSRVSFAPAELMDEMLGTTTSYMKIKTSQIIETFLPYTKHKPRLIDL